MTSIEAYKSLQLKVNSLASGENPDISIGEFVLMFNEQQEKWASKKFTDRSSRFSLDEVQNLVETEFNLTLNKTLENLNTYNLPNDYLDYIRSRCKASKNKCKRSLKCYQIMNTDVDYVITDESNKPSFEFGETPVVLAGNNLQVYKTDFLIDSVFLTYYRYPKSIDIAGYKRIDGTASTTINPELPNDAVNQIIDLIALEIKRNFDDPEGFQLSSNRIDNQ